MFPELPEEILALIPNYKINLIVPNELSDEELDKFHSNLRQIFTFLKYSKDKVKLRSKIESDPHFHSLDADTIRVINNVAGTHIRTKKGDVTNNLSNAIDEMIQDACNEVREGGLKALVSSLSQFINDFDQLLHTIQANETYADVTPEQIRKYYRG